MLPDLEFHDFIGMAVLFSVLLGITVLEYNLRISKRQDPNDIEEKNFKRAGTFAFSGIILMILLAPFVEGNLLNFGKVETGMIEAAVLVLPVFLLFGWAYSEYKASNVIDMRLLRAELDGFVAGKCVTYLEEKEALNETYAVSINDIYQACKPTLSVIEEVSGLARKSLRQRRTTRQLERIIGEILPDDYSRGYLGNILKNLTSEGKIRTVQNGEQVRYYLCKNDK